jgi:hypothetical protein
MLVYSAAAALCASPALAVTVNIDSITAGWANAVSEADVTTIDGTTVSWGNPDDGGGLSDYVFTPTDPTPFQAENPFDLGVFTHENFPIRLPSLDSVDLVLSVAGTIDGVAFTLDPVFGFEHVETPNDATPCAEGGDNPCPDLVRLGNVQDLSEVVTVDGQDYTIVIEGFVDVVTGELTESYLTEENQNNNALLRARIDEPLPPPPPPPAPIPLPAAGWALLAGIGGLGLLRRRASRR